VDLRRRLTLMSAAVVGVTVVLAAVVCFAVMRGNLRGQVDDALRAQAMTVRQVERFGHGRGLALRLLDRLPLPPARFGPGASFAQVLDPSGAVAAGAPDALPVGAAERDAAGGTTDVALRDAEVDGLRVRVLTRRLPEGGAIQLARSLEGVDATLTRLKVVLALLCVAGIALAAALGRLFARTVIGPVTRLSAATGHIEATGDLGARVPVPAGARDEVGRLASGFNRMLDRLQRSQAAQRRLVADASHELRTPVTSLRTNAELLRDAELDADTRRAIAADVVDQAEELTLLVSDVIDLARDEAREPSVEAVRLDDLAREALERARRHAPAIEWALEAEPVVVDGAPERLARAINNLLDNAARYAPAGSRVDVAVRGRELTVRDRGPGIDAAELPHVFDRFFRGTASRGRQGSGLGLAIVKQVADAHQATVALEAADGGGTVARLRFPADQAETAAVSIADSTS
jgi:two-component system, OmpR family, sensor histidine kinase MprB